MMDEGRNGIRPPTPGTQGALAWAVFDEIGYMVTIKQALAIAKERGLTESNVRSELSNWRRYNGVRI